MVGATSVKPLKMNCSNWNTLCHHTNKCREIISCTGWLSTGCRM